MDIKPFLHKHYLLYDCYGHYDNIEEASCDKCNQQIDGWAYSCESCQKFWLHSYCAEEQLPPQISYPLHTQHLLTRFKGYDVDDFICDKCFTLSRGHRYHCSGCNFKVDVSCAASTNDAALEKLKSKRSDEGLRKIQHFVHINRLTGIFNYRKVAKKHYNCGWCEKNLSGMTYGCFESYEKFYIHESCLIKIPTKILGHPFHSSHPLYLQPTTMVNNSEPRCNACKDAILGKAYRCQKCEFHLHVLCSRLQPCLKHEIHEHSLTSFQKNLSEVTYQCNLCFWNIGAEYWEYWVKNFYRCVQCDINFHFSCLKIPPYITHEYHIHDLLLVAPFEEDDSGEYYCDICEEERNAKHHIYYCKECAFITHIQCALKKVDSEALILKLMKQEETEKGNAESQSQDLEREIEHFTHRHSLSYYEVIEKNEDVFCKACDFEIYGQAYGCESCEYYLHSRCAKLSYEVLHPLHPKHPLQLSNDSQPVFCNECGDFSFGFSYVCSFCDFKLDVKCVTLTEPNNEGQRLKEMARESKLCPLDQDHELSFFNFRHKVERGFLCSICFLPLSGLTYHCSACSYVVHESCLGFPLEIALPTLSEHPLHPTLNKGRYTCCLACRCPFSWEDIVYKCEQFRDISLHILCANAMRQAMRSKSHQHPLFYFGTECQKLFASMLNYEFFRQHFLFECNKCYKSFSGVPFYRCVLCCINFHLECVPVPHFIKSKCHIHPFTLRHCFLEDDSGKYFCDVCEEERHPKNHVYVCEECQGLFVAHIECVLDNMVEEIVTAEDPSSNLVPDLENTFGQAEREVSTDESKEEQQSNNVSPAMKERAAE